MTNNSELDSAKETITEADALAYHTEGQPGKVSVLPTKPLMTQRDLSLGYSPGVAYPCLEIEKDPLKSYEYTARGNYVAVISNGTAVLGLGNLGALASKPVMEGKAILFKRFADIDSVDVEVDTTDVDEFVNCVKLLGPSWGGINLEDIGAPECFIIEQKLREIMDIPVFHDDQHGTAIISAAGLINVAHMSGKKLEDLKVVSLGAGAAGIACIELMKTMGVKHENVILCDRSGVIYEGRTESMNQWKSAHAVKTDKRTLEEAMDGADVFLGLSAKDAVTPEMVKSMAKNPIIFAMANPDPEIKPEIAKEVRPDAIIATGRSDYPNQVNNVMGFPYIFRGALDVRASKINEEMKIAAANAIAELAREQVPEEVSAAYGGRQLEFGPDYIIPAPFDPRLIVAVSSAVAQAAMDSGVARKPIEDMEAYKQELAARRDPTTSRMQHIYNKIKGDPKRIIFAEGEEERVIRAASEWKKNGYGEPILVGRSKKVVAAAENAGISLEGLTIANASVNRDRNDTYIDYLYPRLQRKGFLYRDVGRMVKNDRNIYASCMLACGDGDALVTGLTRNYHVCLQDITRVIDEKEDEFPFGISVILSQGRTLFIADSQVQVTRDAEMLAKIAARTAAKARVMGHEPRVAFLSYSTFGNPISDETSVVREVIDILDQMNVDFEYDGEMSASVALNKDMRALYPFSRLSGPANILITPGLHSAHISTALLEEVGNCTSIGPVLQGLEHPVQIVPMTAGVPDILNMAAVAAIDAIESDEKSVPLEKSKRKTA